MRCTSEQFRQPVQVRHVVMLHQLQMAERERCHVQQIADVTSDAREPMRNCDRHRRPHGRALQLLESRCATLARVGLCRKTARGALRESAADNDFVLAGQKRGDSTPDEARSAQHKNPHRYSIATGRTIGSPRNHDCKHSATPRANASNTGCETKPICGVSTTLGNERSG